MTFDAVDVIDADATCVQGDGHVEAACATRDSGELGRDLRLELYTGAATDAPTWSGTIRDLTSPVALGSLARNAVSSLTLVATLPASTGNGAQGDALAFGLRFRLTAGGTTTEARVEGAKFTRGPGLIGRLLDALPLTGVPIVTWTALGLLALGLGALAAAVARAHGRPSQTTTQG